MEHDDRLLGVLPEPERRKLLAGAKRHRYKRGETIFHEGDPGDCLHLIASGHVAIRMTTPLGEAATFTVLGPGHVFGEQALLAANSRRSATAVTLDATDTHAVDRESFEALRRANPEVERFLTAVLTEQVRRLNTHLLEALYVPVGTRVLRRLVALTDTFPEANGSVKLPITQDDLASLAGTSRATANRVLGSAAQAGILALSRGRVEILDREALVRRAR